MQLKRLGLGVRFDFLNMGAEAEMRRLVFEELFSVLTISDLQGLSIYGGLDASSPTGEAVYIAVIMGGKLKRMRRIYNKIREDAAIGMYLCHTQPFWENNRLEAMPAPLFFGQVGADGRLTGGEAELGLRASARLGRRSHIGKGIHILLAPAAFGPLDATEALKQLAFAARSSFPGVRILPLPLMEGGGCITALVTAAKGSMRSVDLGREKLRYGVLHGSAAIVEGQADSHATGVVLRRVLDEGIRTVYITHAPTQDGGMGCARALGVKFYDAEGALLEKPVPDMRVDTEPLHPMAAETRFILMCSDTAESMGEHVMDLLDVKRQSPVEAMLDAVGFTRLLTGKALVITGGTDIGDEACLGAHAMRSICRRTAPFGVPVVAMSCAGWDDPEEGSRSPRDVVGVVKVPLRPDMSRESAVRIFGETASRLFRFIRLGRDVEKLGAPKKEPRRSRCLPRRFRRLRDEGEPGPYLD